MWKIPVHLAMELLGILRRGCGSDVIEIWIRWVVGRGKVRNHVLRYRIEHALGNGVVSVNKGKELARIWIFYRCCKKPLELGSVWHSTHERVREDRFESLVVEKEERLIFLDGSANCAPPLVLLVRRLPRPVEEVARVQVAVAEKLESRAVVCVGSRADDCVHNGRAPALVRREGIPLDVEFLNGVNRRPEIGVPPARGPGLDPVQKVASVVITQPGHLDGQICAPRPAR